MSGTAACRGLQHRLLGSVSGALAAAAPCPVVAVAPNDALRQPGPVLVGDDGSEHAMRAVRHAEALAARLGSDLVPCTSKKATPVEGPARDARERRACLAVAGTRARGPLRGELHGPRPRRRAPGHARSRARRDADSGAARERPPGALIREHR